MGPGMYLKLGAVLLIVGLIGAGYYAYNDMQKRLTTQAATIANQKIVVDTLQQTNDRMEQQRVAQAKANRELDNAFRNSEKNLDELRSIFARHNLERLAKEKPGLIEYRINKGSLEAIKSLEEITK